LKPKRAQAVARRQMPQKEISPRKNRGDISFKPLFSSGAVFPFPLPYGLDRVMVKVWVFALSLS
jgi:hypothetical protein